MNTAILLILIGLSTVVYADQNDEHRNVNGSKKNPRFLGFIGSAVNAGVGAVKGAVDTGVGAVKAGVNSVFGIFGGGSKPASNGGGGASTGNGGGASTGSGGGGAGASASNDDSGIEFSVKK